MKEAFVKATNIKRERIFQVEVVNHFKNTNLKWKQTILGGPYSDRNKNGALPLSHTGEDALWRIVAVSLARC